MGQESRPGPIRGTPKRNLAMILETAQRVKLRIVLIRPHDSHCIACHTNL